MSKISRLLIAIMVTALLYMGAVRGYQFYQNKVAQWEEERQNQASAAFSFQDVPVSLAAPQAEAVPAPVILPADVTSMNILPENGTAPAQYTAETTPQSLPAVVFLEDVPLSAQDEIKQAKDTLRSIVQDYKNEPEIKSFNRELAQVTNGQAVDLSSLSTGDLHQVLQDNPQIQAVVSKHMKDPDFAKKVQQILSNPQFVQSVQRLQRNAAATQKAK